MGRAARAVTELWRTFLLALALFLFFFMVLFVVYYFLHVDYRFLFMGVRTFQPPLLVLLAMYVPFFFIFLLSNSLRINGAMRFEGREPSGKACWWAALPIHWA